MEFWQAVAFLEPEQLVDVAKAAEECGFDTITMSDHIFYPADLQSSYPYTPDGKPFWAPDTPFPDPWVTIGAMASVTTRLRFTTNIYIAGARDLFTVAKLVSTAAVLAGGRVALGAGAGWCKDEFDQTGQPFENRGPRLDEMIEALRKLWAGGDVTHRGRFYDFGPLQISPVPDGPVPVYIGGDTKPALRRAARLGDGWLGNAYTADDARAVLGRLDAELREAGRTRDGFHTVIALLDVPSPQLYRRFEDLGVTAIVCAPWMVANQLEGSFNSPLQAKIDAMRQFSDEVIQKMGS